MENEQKITLTREQWLDGSLGLLQAELNINGLPQIRASMGQTGQKKISRSFPIEQSTGGMFEILISVHTNDSIQILARLVHELAHALTGDTKRHGPKFAAHAGLMGLLSPFQQHESNFTYDLRLTLESVLDTMGPIPHATINYTPDQKGRNSAVVRCTKCGFKYNTSAKWIEKFKANQSSKYCHGCNQHTLTIV